MTTIWMSAGEAARALGIRRASLYAYVSRGLVRSEPQGVSSRERRYSRADVERLRRRAAERRNPSIAAERALQWGVPVLESSITLISDDALYYRGLNAVMLAQSRTVDDVASLIWTGGFGASLDRAAPRWPTGIAGDLPFVQRAQAALAVASARDPQSLDLRVDAVVRTGWRILRLMGAAAATPKDVGTSVDTVIARAWHVSRDNEGIIRSALILCADHELNVSAFTVRCAASAGSTPYAAVIAGLAALQGTRHGGASVRAATMLNELRGTRRLQEALADRLRRGERIEGFGHPLYPGGDPRARALLHQLSRRYPRSADLRFALRTAAAAEVLIGERPNIDYALATIALVLGLPADAPLALFAIGRTIGWIGHAIEQYAAGHSIRPRAKYVGRTPDELLPQP